ncbi:MAG: hypothetical protein ACREOE_02100, partial [Gemmatimonadales bacterium]
MVERHGPATADPAVVTAGDMVAGHVGLDISCLDRLYLNGYVAKLQTPGGVIYFFHDHRGKPIVSPALFEPIGEKFRRDIKDWAQANGVPVIRFRAGERKADVMAPYLGAAAASGRSQVAAVGCAQEFQLVWTARKRDTDPGMCPQFSFTKEQRRVSVFCACIWDSAMGSGFIKICSYFPYPVKARVNGHEWARRQALAAGIGFTALPAGSLPARTRPGCRPSATGSAPAPCRCGPGGGWPGSRCRSPAPTGTPGTGSSCRCGRSRPPAPWSSTTTSTPARSPGRCCARTW